MWSFYTGGCLTEVTTCAGFTVFNFFSDIDIKKRFNAQNWISTSAELKIQWLKLFTSLFTILYEYLYNYSLVNHFLLIYTIN
jgi:hypothetical protein